MRALKEFSFTCWSFARSSLRCSSKLVSCPQMAPVNEFSLDHYDAIGFDFDHTICKYKLPALFNLIYDSLAKYLVNNCNYPKFLLDKVGTEPHCVQKGIILDKARGNFLKLDKDWKIAQAYHGTSAMSKEDVIAAYGNQCTWDDSVRIPYKMNSSTYFREPFYIFKDYFTTIGATLCAKIVDHLDSNNKGPLSTYIFFKDYLNALYYIYDRDNFKRNTGYFFPAIKENPHMYIEQCSAQLKQWLKNIKKEKKVFLLSSAHSDILRFLAEICIGDDWKDYFDVIVTFAQKPSFFTNACPFYELQDDEETNQISIQQMRPSEIYSQGNSSELTLLLGSLCDISTPKVLYVGDSMLEDVYAPSHFVGWDTVGVVEEISAENCSQESKHLLHSDTWGSFFIVQNDGIMKQSLWAALLSEHSKLVVPSVNALSCVALTDKVPAFSSASPFAGYFPTPPELCKGFYNREV